MCYHGSGSLEDSIWINGIKIFLVFWAVAVPIVMTARLDKIIKLLEKK